MLAQDSCADSDCRYDPHFCPRYWHRVFVIHWGEEPKGVLHPRGDDDPRWDILLKDGLPLHRQLKSEEEEFLRRKAAS
jgi:hypothetical protein